MMKMFVLVIGGFFLFSESFCGAQPVSTEELPEQIQKLSQQSQKLIDDYKTKKKDLEAELQQKLKTLTNSTADRLRRRQWMEETNQKIQQLQEDFNLEMDSIQEAKNKLIRPESDEVSPSPPVHVAPRPRAFSDEELKQKMKDQDELILRENERFDRRPLDTSKPVPPSVPQEPQNPPETIPDGNIPLSDNPQAPADIKSLTGNTPSVTPPSRVSFPNNPTDGNQEEIPVKKDKKNY